MQRDDWLAVLVILVGAQLALTMLGFELVLRSIEAGPRPLVRVYPPGEGETAENVSALSERRARRQREPPEERPL